LSVRYNIALIPEPSFTARVYRARQLICGQYATWAAEMHMLHLTLAGFFQCPEDAVATVSDGLIRLAQEAVQAGGVPLAHKGVATYPEVIGNIFLDFSPSGVETGINRLHGNVIDLLQRTPGVTPEMRFTGPNYRPHISLMQYANLTQSVFDSAVDFAREMVRDLKVPDVTRAWQLVLTRFRSEAAGDDWDHGRWAADLSWQSMASYPL
jgi:2'-5' RNA ligase